VCVCVCVCVCVYECVFWRSDIRMKISPNKNDGNTRMKMIQNDNM
jgi:hypothetical protein